MAKLVAINAGLRPQAIKVRGGTVTVKPNRRVDVEPKPDLDKETVARYKALGVTFEDAGKKKKAATDNSASEKSAALKTAEDAVLSAMAKLEKAGDDMVAKAAAEDELKAAEAALAALKG